MPRFQLNYQIYQQGLWPGMIAAPKAPYHIIQGRAQVPSSGRKPRPGDSLYYDTTNEGWAFPTSAAQRILVRGICVYDAATVPDTLASVPSNANSDKFIQYDDGMILKVCLHGIVAVTAGAGIDPFEIVQQLADHKYDPFTRPTTVAAMHSAPIEYVGDDAAVDNQIIPVAIGYGRAV